MRWRGWNRRVVRGRGLAWLNDCIPFCAYGHFHYYRARARLYRRRYCPAVERYVYTRLRYHYIDVPPGAGSFRGSTVPFACRMYSY